MKERVSKLTYPTLQHCLRMLYTTNGNSKQSDRKPVSSKLHKIILAKVQKRYKLLLKKIKSAFPVKMHIYTLCIVLHNYKVSRNSIEQFFRGIVLTECFRSIFHFGQISKFKKGVIPRKKMESKFPVDMHIYMVCPS